MAKFKFLLIIIVPATIAVLAFLWMKAALSPLPDLEISTERGEDWGWLEDTEWNRFSDDLMPINYTIRLLLDSPFVLVGYHKSIETDNESDAGLQWIYVLIDLDRGTRIMQTRWENEPYTSLGTHQLGLFSSFIIQKQPYFMFTKVDIELPLHVRYFYSKTAQDTYLNTNTQKCYRNKHYLLDSSGKIQKNTKYPYFMYPPIAGPDIIPAIGSNKQDLANYSIEPDGTLKERIVWEGAGMPSSCFPLEDGSYFGNVLKKKTYTFFLHTTPPTFQDFPFEDLQRIYPTQLTPFPFQFTCLSTHNRNAPCIVCISDIADRPVFEIQRESIEKGRITDIFRLIGAFKELKPLGVFHNNEAMLLTYDEKNYQRSDSQSLFLARRETDENGKTGMFQKKTKALPIGEVYHPTQLDSERLLFWRKKALWTMKYDGSEVKKVFPPAGGE